jgi:DNA-binding response OmpR family regulator
MKENKKILIVDDDPDILEALQLTFESEGYQTKALINGDEAYSHVYSYNPDAIVLDVLLSGTDGRIICKQLKTENETKDIPIIMISAHPDAARSTKEVGADEFISKPFDINHLITVIEKYIN